jgi:hypothetical protein
MIIEGWGVRCGFSVCILLITVHTFSHDTRSMNTRLNPALVLEAIRRLSIQQIKEEENMKDTRIMSRESVNPEIFCHKK